MKQLSHTNAYSIVTISFVRVFGNLTPLNVFPVDWKNFNGIRLLFLTGQHCSAKCGLRISLFRWKSVTKFLLCIKWRMQGIAFQFLEYSSSTCLYMHRLRVYLEVFGSFLVFNLTKRDPEFDKKLFESPNYFSWGIFCKLKFPRELNFWSSC